jgi:glyoxylase-like metal-dependent hydrolase (beta-lactamase superfamily II)
MVGPPPDSWAVDPAAARAFEIIPGLWQLRLPLPWPRITSVNAYAVATDTGLMLIDCGGAGDPTATDGLENALALAGFSLADVSVLVGTHTHSDHIGPAEHVLAVSGATFWMHPDTAHFYDAMRRPAEIAAARRRRAHAEGVPDDLLGEFADVREETDGVMAAVEPHRALVDGVRLPSAVGDWQAIATPGHAPSHVCLIQPEHGIAIVGDVLMSVLSPYFDYGYSEDPYAEHLSSLDRLAALDGVTLVLPGHGRPFGDIGEVVARQRQEYRDRVADLMALVETIDGGAWDLAAALFDERPSGEPGVTHTTELSSYLLHMRRRGALERTVGADGRFNYRPMRDYLPRPFSPTNR